MSHYTASPAGEEEHAPRKPNGAAMGPDPVSPARFAEIVDADRDTGDYSIRPQQSAFDLKGHKLGLLNWAMAIAAGIILGIVMTMIAAT